MKINIKDYPERGHRQVNINIEKFDTWSLDRTLAMIIYPSLMQLKATKQGIPTEFATVGGEDYDAQQSFDFYTDSVDDRCSGEEEGIRSPASCSLMDKMTWSFQQLCFDDFDDKYHHGELEFNEGKWVRNGAWYDHVGHMMHLDRIQEGLDLFGKYYQHLWD